MNVGCPNPLALKRERGRRHSHFQGYPTPWKILRRLGMRLTSGQLLQRLSGTQLQVICSRCMPTPGYPGLPATCLSELSHCPHYHNTEEMGDPRPQTQTHQGQMDTSCTRTATERRCACKVGTSVQVIGDPDLSPEQLY